MKFKNLLLAFACSAFLFTACSDDDEPVINNDAEAQNVPQKVKDEFHKLYKNVKDVKWENVKGYHVARFNGSISRGSKLTFTSSAWFTQDGMHCQAEEDLEFNELPAVVQDKFMIYKDMNYPGWEIDDCEVVSRLGMGLIYVVEIEKGEQEREISLSAYGDILKDVADDDDDDLDDVLPILIPDELKDALEHLFPTHFESVSIVEIDFEDKEVEVDVMMGTDHLEIKFDLNYKWISTEYEAAMKDFLEMIGHEFQQTKEKLIALAEQFKIDIYDPLVQKHIEIEVEEHYLRGKSYSIEIKLGDLEIEFHIDRNGKISVEKD